MKLNRLLIITLVLLTLICLPISFASECDADSIGDSSLGEDVSGSLLDCSDIEKDVSGSLLDDSNILNRSVLDIDSDSYIKVEHNYGQSNSKDYNSPNLSTDFTILNQEFTDSNTIFVNASYDGDVEDGTMENPFKTLNAAYNLFSSSSNSKINMYLANGVYPISNVMTINKNINIVGESTSNTIISGQDKYQIFSIAPPRTYGAVSPFVNIFNLTLAGGVSYYGGAIYINESGANFVNVNFINNTARNTTYYSTTYPGSGGAIYIDKAFVKFYNASFIENKALGKTDAYAGALINDMGETSILNSRFVNNSVNAKNGAGGAIYDYSGILVIFNSTISNNTINSNFSMGGAISNWASHNIFILNSTIDGNRIYGDYTFGSAIINKANNLIISNTTISNNLANGTSDLNGTLFNLNGFINSSNLQFENNIAKDPQNPFMCLEDQLIVERAFDDASLTDLPAKYDLRDYGLVTSVKDQGGSGSCWAFATLAALESYLLKNENTYYDFSENNMKNLMGFYGLNGTDWSDGGNHFMSLAYLLRWSGPVNETLDPFDDTSHSSKSNLNLTKHVQDVLYLPVRLNYMDTNQIKAALMTYGALYTTIYADNNFQFDPDYYCDIISISNHAITIVGWDDDYSADNFDVKPPGDGAFIIKNSWNTNYGYEGYWYISYYDKTFAGYGLDCLSAVAFTNVENVTNYKNNYQYDILGNTFESVGFGCSTAWFANQFTALNNNPLSAFGLYTFGNSSYLAEISVNGIVKHIQEGAVKGAGYHTIKLDEFVDLSKGDIFRIAVKLTTPISLFPVAIETQRSGYSSVSDAEEGQSFISPDGINWYDLASYNQVVKFYQYAQNRTLEKANVCLKAYASGYADVFLNIKSNASSYYRGDTVEINLTLTNEGDPINDVDIKAILDTGVLIKSAMFSKGAFNLTSRVWHLDGLNQGESVTLNLKLAINSIKDIVTLSFNFNYSGYLPADFNSTKSLSLYYAGLTNFVQLENIATFVKSQDEVLITLLDWNSSPLANKPVVVSLLDYDGSGVDFTPVSLITDGNGNARFILDLLSGNYVFLVSFDGDEAYNSANMTFNVLVSKIATEIKMIGGDDSNNVSTVARSNDEVKFCLVDGESKVIRDKTLSLVINELNQVYDLVCDDDGFFRFNLDLTAGVYEFLVSFGGDDAYEASNLTLGVDVSRIATEIKLVGDYDSNNISTIAWSNDEVKFCLVDGESNVIRDKTLSLVNNQLDQVYDLVCDDDGFFRFNLDLSSGIYEFLVSFGGDDAYDASNLTLGVDVSRIATEVKVWDDLIEIETFVKSEDEVLISLLDWNSSPLANKPVVVSLLDYDGSGVDFTPVSLTTDKNGNAKFVLNLLSGNYVFLASFGGDDVFESANMTFNVLVSRIATEIKFLGDYDSNNVSTVARSNDEIKFCLVDGESKVIKDKTLSLVINELNQVYDLDCDDDGFFRFNLDLTAGVYEFLVSFAGDDVYNLANLTLGVDVSRIATEIKLVGGDGLANVSTVARSNDEVKFCLVDGESKVIRDKTLSLVINELNQVYDLACDDDGFFRFNLDLTAGVYEFLVSFAGDDVYNLANLTLGVDVSRIATEIKLVGGDGLANVSTVARSNDEVKFILVDGESKVIRDKTLSLVNNQLNQVYDLTSDEEGFFRFNLDLTAGVYEFLVSFAGDDVYNLANLTLGVDVSRIATEIKLLGDYDLNNVSTVARSDDEVKFYLVDADSNVIKDKTLSLINNQLNKAYDLACDDDGFFKFNLDLLYGSYDFSLAFLGDDIYNKSDLSFIVNVLKKDSPNISIEKDLLNVYENLKINLRNQDGNGLSNEILKIIITNSRGKQSSLLALTDDEGSVELFNMYQGSYMIDIIFENDDVYGDSILSSNFTVAQKESQIIYSDMVTTAVDTAVDGRVGEYFIVVLKDSEGNALTDKAVQIGFNGKVYNRTTDENGSCRLQINLPRVDIYTFAVCFLGDEDYIGSFVVAKITVNPQNCSLTVPDKSYKASAKTKSLSATFKAASGRVAKGKKVSFTVNGKTYTATTNNKGVATVNVSLNKKGTYNFTVKFAGDKTYAATTKKAKLTIR